MTALAGTGTLIRFILRRDRVRLPVWVLGITLSTMGSVASFGPTYPTAADRQAQAELDGGAVMKLFTGPGYGLDNYTYGAMTSNELLVWVALAMALMSIFLVVRHTRAEEESGRAELVRATVVGRHAPTAATLIVVGGANLLVGALLTAALPASLDGLSTRGSFAFAASATSVGLVLAGVAVFVGQLTMSGRSAIGISAAVLGGSFVLRGLGDMSETALSWLSPFGWASQTRAYVDERWWPLALAALATAGLAAAAATLAARRDLGAGIIADRPGPATASPRLGTPLGLAFRLQRASLFWWSISLLLMGLVYGGTADQAAELYEDLSAIDDYLARIGAAAAVDQYLALTAFVSALIAAAYPIQSATRLKREETELRAEPVLATPVGRLRFAASHLAMALGGSVVLLFMYGLGVGGTRALSTGDAGELPRLLGSTLAYAPALWVLAGLATALVGLAPRAVGVAWGVLGAMVFAGWLGPLLKFPEWTYDLSPVEHVPRLPVADFSAAPLALLTAVAAALLAIGLAGFRRRDVGVA